MIRVFLITFLSLIFLNSCSGIDRRGGILKYQKQTVSTAFGHFKVPLLTKGWKNPKIRQKQLIYENDSLGATIVVDSLCGPKFSESPLPRLAKDLFAHLQGVQVKSEKFFQLQGRQAFRLEGEGSLDGVLLRMSVIVTKRDFCLYDFVFFSQTGPTGLTDFEEFINGIQFR